MSESDGCENTVPLVDWVKKDGKICRPCVLPVLAGWYKSELEETGNQEQAQRISQIAEKPDVTPDELAAELDNIKSVVQNPELKARLKEFDCAIQANE